MTSGESVRRLGKDEVRALRRAGQRQLKRWNKAELDAEGQQQCAELKRALRVLRHVRDGCELISIRGGD